MMAITHIYRDKAATFDALAQEFAALARAAAARSQKLSIALAGGSTPAGFYRVLASKSVADTIPWKSVRVFFGDERTVAPTEAESNYRMAKETLLDSVPIPPRQVHRLQGEHKNLEEAAQAYESELRRYVAEEGGIPTLDLVLLGLGEDGHTASLFPESAILQEQQRLVAPVFVSRLCTWRLSFTLPLINHSRRVCFLVLGQEKAEIVKSVLQPAPGQKEFPSQLVKPRGELHWYLDEAAAGLLGKDKT